MSKRVETVWNLRQLMADQGLFKTTELIPLLEEFGVSLSGNRCTDSSPRHPNGPTYTSSGPCVPH